MKKIALVFASLCVFCGAIYAQKTEVFEKKNKFGIRQDEKVLVKPEYESLELLSPKFYAAKKKNLVAVINPTGQIIIPGIYDNIKYYGENIFLVQKDNKWGLINRSNKIILPIEYTDFKFVEDDICEFKKDGKVGLVSKYGYSILPASYDNIKPLGNNYIVSLDGKNGIVDGLGKILTPIKYDSFKMMPDSASYSVTLNNKQGLLDYSCKIVLDAVYDNIEESPIGLITYQNGKIGFYTNSGKLIPAIYTQVLFFQPEFGLAVVKIGDKFALVRSNGVESSADYENISRFAPNGIAFVEKSGKLMAINLDGKEMTVQETMSNSSQPKAESGSLPQVGPPF